MRKKKIKLRIDDRDVMETMSFLMYKLRIEGLGISYRNRITMRFLEIVRYRGVRSKYKIFRDLSEFIEIVSKNRFSLELINS